MTNQTAINISCTFNYDGVSPSVSIDSRKGPVVYNSSATLHPMFYNVVATDIIDAGFALPTTATINREGVITVAVASGTPAGLINFAAVLIYPI